MGCDSARYPCAPIQFAMIIIPRAIQASTRPQQLNEFEWMRGNNDQKQLSNDASLIRIQSKHCVKEVVQRDFCGQLLSIWNSKKLGLSQKRHQQYVCIIDRRNGNDTLYFMVSKKERPSHHLRSVSELKANRFGMHVDGTIHFRLSYYLLTQTHTKSYIHLNYGGHKFDLTDMEWLWPRFFHKINTKRQVISDHILKEIKACKMNYRFRDDDFDEFIQQNKYLISNKPKHSRVQLNKISQAIADHFLSMATNGDNIKLLIMDHMHRYSNTLTLCEIIKDINHPDGKLLNGIFNVIRDRLIDEHTIQMIRTNIRYEIQAMMGGTHGGEPKYFMLSQFDLNVTQSEIDQAAQTMYANCPIIFTHAESGEMAQDKCLCKAKAMDIKNGVPLTLWLLDMFCRDRIERYKCNTLTTKYTISEWWNNHNSFTRFIRRNYPNKHDEIRQALCCLVKRALPYLNLNPSICPVINDSLNDFVRYTLASHAMMQCIIPNELNEVFPIQFDFWIIPQTVKTQTFVVPYETDDEDIQNEEKEIIHSMSKVGQRSAIPQNSFWNLEPYLKTSGYQKGKDYFVATPSNNATFMELRHQLHTMWKDACGDKHRFRRYIFVIDRRNPINLQKQNMSHIKPNLNAPKHWDDTIYLIIPKERFMRHNKCSKKCDPNVHVPADTITKKFYELNECMLGESRKYLIPYPFSRGDDGTLSILDSVNGYKFALSYHLYQTNNCKCYWYLHGGGQYFELNDMRWLWPKFFTTINGKEQQMDPDYLRLLHHSSQLQRLPNPKFYEFLKQTNHL